ncbi:hypothetical protein C2S51_025203 [Perilla frutescens var. frutescens]|nr:hypothetical protein C2S51_025203 [Perilla frutescens var. frutescens]
MPKVSSSTITQGRGLPSAHHIISLAAAQCTNPPVIFHFGDSNSDTGGAAALLGGPYVDYPQGRTFFHEPTYRPALRWPFDHRLSVLDTKYLTPYTETFDRNFSNGVNFALSGSSTARPQPDSPFALNIQISEFIRFRNRSIQLGCREDDFKNALYTIDIGQNDMVVAFKERTHESVLRKIVPFVVSKIRIAILAIYHLGGKNFWVHGTGPLGCLPSELATRNASESLDKYGCISFHNEAAKQLNLELDRMCQELRRQMGISTIVFVDVYPIKYDLITSSSSYGFEHPLVACPIAGRTQ